MRAVSPALCGKPRPGIAKPPGLQVAAVPLVSICFTWWHVWLGIKMCFYPVHFKGCCKPFLGWQGIVPRRSNVMAERACDIMVRETL